MSNFITDYLYQYYDEVTPKEFYRDIFPVGSLEKKGVYETGKYNAIAVEISKKIRRFTITDDLNRIDYLLKSDKFIIVSPITYCGKTRKSNNARFIYALAIDLDGIKTEQHLRDLFYQIKNEVLPKPSYVVSSGSGLHLYYVFKEPIPLFRNIVKQLTKLRNELIKHIWNKYTTTLYKKVQYESLFQGFRLVGGVTKNGSRTRAFLTGEKIDLEYLNNFVSDENRVKEFKYQSKLTLAQAKEKYPQWYEERIVQKKPKGVWTVKRDLFDWWFERIKEEKTVGHRYYCIMCLCIYAKKCGITQKELKEKAYSLLDNFDEISESEENRFTKHDIDQALEMYSNSYITFPRDTISMLTDIDIKANKRNYRKQETHIKFMNNQRAFKVEIGECTNGGRPKGTNKAHIVKEWQEKNPQGTKAQCIRETGLSKHTVYKWWNSSSS